MRWSGLQHGSSSIPLEARRLVWKPGVCYSIWENVTLDGRGYQAIAEPLHACTEKDLQLIATLFAMLVLSFVQILLQLVWYMR